MISTATLFAVPIQYALRAVKALLPEPEHVHRLVLEDTVFRGEGLLGPRMTYFYTCDAPHCEVKFSTSETDRVPSNIGPWTRGSAKDTIKRRMYQTP